MALTLTIFYKDKSFKQYKGIIVDILWDGTCVSLSFDNFRL